MEEQVPNISTPSVPLPPASPLPPQAKGGSKTLIWVVLAIILFLGLISVGVVLGQRGFLSGILPGRQPLPTPTTIAQPTPTPDPTANWETYTNEKYGFSLKYPPSWQLEDATGFFKEGGVFSALTVGETQKKETEFYDGARLVVGLPLKTSKTIKEWVNEYYPTRNVNDEPNVFSEESINGKVFQKVHACGLGCYDYFNIVSDGYVYRIMTFSGGPEKAKHEVTLDQILSTFKFLDEDAGQSNATANWKTYTNQRYGYAVKYPKDWDVREWDNSGSPLTTIQHTVELKRAENLLQVNVWHKPIDSSLASWLADTFRQSGGVRGRIQLPEMPNSGVLGIPAFEAYVEGAAPAHVLIFAKGSRVYEIYMFGKRDAEPRATYDQILSSFKFIE